MLGPGAIGDAVEPRNNKGVKMAAGAILRKGEMRRTAFAIIAAASVAAAFITVLSFSMNLEANAHVQGTKGDRADLPPLATNCSDHAWPYFEACCLRDPTKPFAQARQVRLVSTDRIALATSK
jgi:hypothetical protein